MRRSIVLTAAATLVAGLTTVFMQPAQAGPTMVNPVQPPLFNASGWKPRPATYKEKVTRDLPVTMSDGNTLFVDVYQPADLKTGAAVPGRFPVLLTQTPYNKSVLSFHSAYLVTRGFVQVVADVRGTGSSQGQWSSLGEREQRDGLDLANWTTSADRPWSNGKLAVWGTSYGAIEAMLTAAQQPKGLKAAFPIVPGADLYRDVAASGGALDVGFIPLWLGAVTMTGVLPPAYTSKAPDVGLGALFDHLSTALGFTVPLVTDAALGSDRAYDSDWYRTRSPISHVKKVRIPTFIVGGEFDLFQRGEPMLFDRLQRQGVPAKLVYGPWEHTAAGIVNFNPLALRWFDHYVNGVEDKALDTDIAPITYYELGSGWRTTKRWLGKDVKARTFQLSGKSGPGTRGDLVTGTPKAGQDPILPMPVNGLCTRSSSQWTAGFLQGNPCDDDSSLSDMVGNSYRSDPLPEDLALLGPINARLFVSSTSSEGMLSVHVSDVAPNGKTTRLSGGWQMLSHRRLDEALSVKRNGEVLQPWHPFSKAAQVPMTPGKVVPVDVEVFSTGAVLKKGHRLQITVQAFDVPHLLPSLPAALGPLGVITIHHSAQHPSRIVLPVRS